jgi:hypothetical protein
LIGLRPIDALQAALGFADRKRVAVDDVGWPEIISPALAAKVSASTDSMAPKATVRVTICMISSL